MHSLDMVRNNTSSAAGDMFDDEFSSSDSDKLSRQNHDVDSNAVLYLAISLMSVVIVIGGIGNIMVILAVRTMKKLQTASNAFVVNLSVCDLVFVIIILPFNIYTYLTDGWNLPLVLCKIIGFLGYTLTGTTIITITMIAWNRYRLVVDPQNYARLFSPRNLALMLTLTWVAPAVCLTPALLEVWGRFGYVTMMVTCNLMLDHDSQSFKLFLLIVRAVIPCFLILYYYLSIYRATKESHRRVVRNQSRLPLASAPGRMDQMLQRKEMRLTKMMATIFIVFALSYFPCTISSMVDWNTVLSKRFHMFCLITVYVGSAVNPLIYGLMNSQFRTAYYTILLCRCCISAADSLLPTYSPSSHRKKHTPKHTPTCKRKDNVSKQLLTENPPSPNPSPMPLSTRLTCSSSLRDSSDTVNYSPLTVKSLATSSLTYRKLSIDSNGPMPLSSKGNDDERLSLSLHRSETEKTWLAD